MIATLEGRLEAIHDHTALIRPLAGSLGAEPMFSGVCYEVLLPAYAASRLTTSIGKIVTLSTLHFVESQNNGALLLPRLAGFPTRSERQFYELFVTCKGIGHRRALRAMVLATDQIAAAIADRDLGLLQSLPEVGRRTAETIVTTLRDKVDRFITASYTPQTAATDKSPGKGKRGKKGQSAAGEETEAAPPPATTHIAREALEALMQLGENRLDAMRMIDQVLIASEDTDDRPRDSQDLLTRVYQMKSAR